MSDLPDIYTQRTRAEGVAICISGKPQVPMLCITNIRMYVQ